MENARRALDSNGDLRKQTRRGLLRHALRRVQAARVHCSRPPRRSYQTPSAATKTTREILQEFSRHAASSWGGLYESQIDRPRLELAAGSREEPPHLRPHHVTTSMAIGALCLSPVPSPRIADGGRAQVE